MIELAPMNRSRQAMDDVTFGKTTPEQMAVLRIRLLLLGELPKTGDEMKDHMLSGMTLRDRHAEVPSNLFIALWEACAGDVVKFLRWARLTAVFYLKSMNLCHQVLELRVGPVGGQRVHVRLRGVREGQWSSNTASIEVEGDAPLVAPKPAATRRRR